MHVFLHMLGGSASEWNSLRAAMPGETIAIDLPGHGGKAGGTPPYRVSVADAAQAVIEEAGLDRRDGLHLVGTSMGGAVAAAVAARLGGRIASLTLISTALTRAMSAAAMTDAETAQTGRDYDGDDRPLPRPTDALTAAFGPQPAEVLRQMEADRQKAGRWIRPCWRGVAEADTIATLASLTCPIRLIHGDEDPYRRFVPDAVGVISFDDIAVVAGTGAFPHRANPAATAAILLRDQAP